MFTPKKQILIILNFPIRFAIPLILDSHVTLIQTLNFTLSRQMIQWPVGKLNLFITQCCLNTGVFVY